MFYSYMSSFFNFSSAEIVSRFRYSNKQKNYFAMFTLLHLFLYLIIYILIISAPPIPLIPQVSRANDTTVGIEIQQAPDLNGHIM